MFLRTCFCKSSDHVTCQCHGNAATSFVCSWSGIAFVSNRPLVELFIYYTVRLSLTTNEVASALSGAGCRRFKQSPCPVVFQSPA